MEIDRAGASEFMLACEKGDIDGVKSMLEKGYEANERDRYNSTALMYAVVSKNLKNKAEIIGALMGHGADLSVINFRNETALILASAQDDVGCFKQLSEYKNASRVGIYNRETDAINKNLKKSLLTRILDVVLYPFRLLGRAIDTAFRKIGGAVLQFFINRTGQKQTSRSENVPTNVKPITKLTSEPEAPHPSVGEIKGRMGFGAPKIAADTLQSATNEHTKKTSPPPPG